MKELKTISDEKLLRQIQSGNDDAMECLLERYRGKERGKELFSCRWG